MAEYNTPVQHFREALESVATQTYRDFELIVVDDGGQNDVGGIVGEFNDPRFRVVKHPANKGLVAALTTGIETSNAALIARMDTDDIYLPRHLELLVGAASAMPEIAVFSARSNEFASDSEGFVVGTPGEKTKLNLVKGDGPSHPATLIRRSALEAVGGYPDYRRAEDFALWCEMLLHGHRLYTIESVTHRYRVNLEDYRKRRLKNRGGEIVARLHYYPLLGASPLAYLKIIRSIAGGILPARLVRQLRTWERRNTQPSVSSSD